MQYHLGEGGPGREKTLRTGCIMTFLEGKLQRLGKCRICNAADALLILSESATQARGKGGGEGRGRTLGAEGGGGGGGGGEHWSDA